MSERHEQKIANMADIYSDRSWRLFDELDVSLNPTGPETLLELCDKYVHSGDRMLDVGCRDARHLIGLGQRLGLHGEGIDPVPWHIERAERAIVESGLQDLSVRVGGIEDIADPDGSYDFVWCRDVIEVLPDLEKAMKQMSRLLKSDGSMIVYTNVLSGQPDDVETERIHEPLGNVVENLIEDNLEGSFARNGLTIEEKLVVGTEWREYLEERDQLVSRDLLRLARLRRSRSRVVAEYGEQTYNLMEASTQWAVYQFLGRFVPTIYVLGKTGA